LNVVDTTVLKLWRVTLEVKITGSVLAFVDWIGRERCVTFSKETHPLDGVEAAKVTWLGGTGSSRLQSDERSKPVTPNAAISVRGQIILLI
jgi:hypothetical protein